MVINDKENVDILSKFFSNTVKNLIIPGFSDTDLLADNMSHPTLKVIIKYRNQASIAELKIKFVGKCLNFLEHQEKILLKKLKN